jgi:hypothetical protein
MTHRDLNQEFGEIILDAVKRRLDLVALVVDEHPPSNDPHILRGLNNPICSGMCHLYVKETSPEAVRRTAEADLRRLERHDFFYANTSDAAWTRAPRCSYDKELWPCAEVRELMEVYQIQPI